MEYKILVAGTAPELYPVETLFGLLCYSEMGAIEITKQYPFNGGWTPKPALIHIFERQDYPMPEKLDMAWVSIAEFNAYSVESPLPVEKMQSLWSSFSDEDRGDFNCITVGMAPYGKVSVWLYSEAKSYLVGWLQAELFDVDEERFKLLNNGKSPSVICRDYINSIPRVRENLEQNGLPPRDLFDNYMKQFTYKYVPMFEVWDESKGDWRKFNEEEEKKGLPVLDYIEEALFDGTHDKLHDGGLMNYHQAGKPKKLAVMWHIKKSEYTAYFWFEDEEIRAVFDRFYGTHPETKTDFMIRIDAEQNKYELALYRYGLKEPQVINESAYQLLVFKNKFECFRSDNYNQPRGAWIW